MARHQAAVRQSRSLKNLLPNIDIPYINPQLGLIVCSIIMTLFGLLMIYSASSITALHEVGNPWHYLARQAVHITIGAILAVVAASIPVKHYDGLLTIGIWILVVVLLITVLIIGNTGGGAQRWVTILGFNMQPSEFAKIAILLALAAILSRYKMRRIEQGTAILLGLGVTAVTIILIFLQRDLGTTIIILLDIIVLLYLAGISGKLLLGSLALIGIFGLGASLASPFRTERLLIVFDPWKDPDGAGYQTIQGLYAFASGGLTGVGLGESRQKFLYLPEAHTDFIFAIIGEELGLIGTLAVLVLFIAFAYFGFQIAKNATSNFAMLLAGGATSLIVIQASINIMCTIGLFPITGKPLPFFSSGGSSIISTLILVGLIVAASRESSGETSAERVRRDFKVLDGGQQRDSRSRDLRGSSRAYPPSSRGRNTRRETGSSPRSSVRTTNLPSSRPVPKPFEIGSDGSKRKPRSSRTPSSPRGRW